MQRVAQILDFDDADDELGNDRIPGLPLLGFFTATVLSLAFWATIAVIAWTV